MSLFNNIYWPAAGVAEIMAADGLDEDIIPLETTEFDAIVIGTGLCESMVAAGLARAGKSVLHLDHRRRAAVSGLRETLIRVCRRAAQILRRRECHRRSP